jgi:hypothetical protein
MPPRQHRDHMVKKLFYRILQGSVAHDCAFRPKLHHKFYKNQFT